MHKFVATIAISASVIAGSSYVSRIGDPAQHGELRGMRLPPIAAPATESYAVADNRHGSTFRVLRGTSGSAGLEILR